MQVLRLRNILSYVELITHVLERRPKNRFIISRTHWWNVIFSARLFSFFLFGTCSSHSQVAMLKFSTTKSGWYRCAKELRVMISRILDKAYWLMFVDTSCERSVGGSERTEEDRTKRRMQKERTAQENEFKHVSTLSRRFRNVHKSRRR